MLPDISLPKRRKILRWLRVSPQLFDTHVASLHAGHEDLKGSLGICRRTTHEYIDRCILKFRPRVHRNVGFGKQGDSRDASAIPESVYMNIEELCVPYECRT